MISAHSHKKHVAVVGAGISGLRAAEKLIDAGYDVTIIDPASRVGGKILTVPLGDEKHNADVAAEFIDSDQTNLIELAKAHNVPLIKSGSLNETFHLPNGKTLSSDEFYKAYLPLSKQIVADKAIIAADPTGEHAKHLDKISMSDYLKELAANVKDERPLWKRVLLFWQKPKVDPNIIKMAEQIFAGEHGRPASKLSALQFALEAGNDTHTFIASDAAWRVEGGTYRLIKAMEARLNPEDSNDPKRAHFSLGKKVTRIHKNGNGFSLGFGDGEEQRYDQVVFATAAHQLAEVKGLEDIGLPKEDVETLGNLQYTRNSKITVRLQDTAENRKLFGDQAFEKDPEKIKLLGDECFFYSDGYQTWQRPGEGSLVFLLGDELPDKYKNPKDLMKHALEDFAKGHHTTVEKLFGTDQLDKLLESGQMNFQGPGGEKPCYASPSPGQSLALRHMSESFYALAQQGGVGFAGTYIPGENGSVGYMGQGVESAERATSLMTGMSQARSQAREIAMEQPQPDLAEHPLPVPARGERGWGIA